MVMLGFLLLSYVCSALGEECVGNDCAEDETASLLQRTSRDHELADEGGDGDWKKGFRCEDGINYAGDFFKKTSGTSIKSCAQKCKKSKACHVFVSNNKGECYLKRAVTRADHGQGGTTSCKDKSVTYHYSLLETDGEAHNQADDEAEDDERDGEAIDALVVDGGDDNWKKGFRCEDSINYAGDFFKKTSGTSIKSCAQKCKKSKACHVFVSNNKGECYLKRAVTRADHGQGGTTSCKDKTVTYHY